MVTRLSKMLSTSQRASIPNFPTLSAVISSQKQYYTQINQHGTSSSSSDLTPSFSTCLASILITSPRPSTTVLILRESMALLTFSSKTASPSLRRPSKSSIPSIRSRMPSTFSISTSDLRGFSLPLIHTLPSPKPISKPGWPT